MRLPIILAMLWSTAPLAAAAPELPSGPPSPPVQAKRSLFDPLRHMRIAEVRSGMKGHGLSVFRGTKIERFEVEVISILENFNPKCDVILIRCKGANLEHTGAIAGMSGSPIYLTDEQGRDRMVGAFAYGWPLMKDPVAGVQPIEYMLELSTLEPAKPATQAVVQTSAERDATGRSEARVRWSLSDTIMLPGMTVAPGTYPLAGWNTLSPNPKLLAGSEDATQLRPLATPLMTAGMPARLREEFEPLLKAYGLVPLQAGGGGKPATQPDEPAAQLEPGSVLAVPLLTGDVEFTAVGTCTEVIGNNVFGFGHAFTNEGAVAMPLGSGKIDAVIANLMTSFKLGAITQTQGTLRADQLVGIAGQIGDTPETIPIDLRITYTDGSYDEPYHFTAALHPRFTPLISAAALSAAVTGAKDLPQYHTLDYDLNLEFANGQTIRVANTAVNASAGDVFYEIGGPLIAAADNPFERVMVKKITGTIRVTPEAREAQILSINTPRLKYRPGETLKAYVTYRPFRAGESILPLELELPRDLPEGQYQLVISDWTRYLTDEQAAKPFRFTAESVDEVFDVLRDVSSIPHNAIYLRLLRQPDGVAIGRTAMPHLPSSRRQVMMGAGRSNTTPFVSSTVKIVPTDLVMSGEADFVLTIDKNAKVELGSAKPPKLEGAAPQKSAEPKPKTPTADETPKTDAEAESEPQESE